MKVPVLCLYGVGLEGGALDKQLWGSKLKTQHVFKSISLMAWVWSQISLQKERTNSWKLSNFYMCTVAYACQHTYIAHTQTQWRQQQSYVDANNDDDVDTDLWTIVAISLTAHYTDICSSWQWMIEYAIWNQDRKGCNFKYCLETWSERYKKKTIKATIQLKQSWRL